MSDATEPLGAVAGEAVAACPNCGLSRSGRFCSHCGQNDRNYLRGLWRVIAELCKETFELDGRVWRTLAQMFRRPGALAQEFSRNRRASYLSPIRLYLFASLAFFFLFAMEDDRRPGEKASARVELDRIDPGQEEALKAALPPLQQRKMAEVLRRDRWAKVLIGLAANYRQTIEGEPDHWDRFLLIRLVDLAEDPRVFFGDLLDNMPIAMFLTLPVYALLLALFFLGSRRYFTEHLVFAVQLQTFAFIVFAAFVALPDGEEPRAAGDAPASVAAASTPPAGDALAAPGEDAPERAPAPGPQPVRFDAADEGWVGWLKTALVLWVLVYHYLALRRFYGNGRLKTSFKWCLLTGAYGLVIVLPSVAISAALALLWP